MTPAAFREIALSLPARPRAPMAAIQTFGSAARSSRRSVIQAWLAMVKLAPEQQQMLVDAEPQMFVPVKGAWGSRGATNVRLGRCRPAHVRSALAMALQKRRCAERQEFSTERKCMTIDIEPLRKQLGRKIEDEDVVTEGPIKEMICTFDRDDKVPAPGEAIAPGWHLCFLHSYARRAQLGRDGAAAEGGVLPRIPMPRRMYAGSTFTFHGDIRMGDKLRREIEFTDIQLRQGSTGALIVTTQTRRSLHAAWPGAERSGQHGVSRGGAGRRQERRAGARGGPQGRAVATHHHARSGDALSIFRGHVQPAPHPLRPHLLHGGRRLSRAGGARAVRPAVPVRPVARFAAGPAASRPSPCAPAPLCSTPRRSMSSAARPQMAAAPSCGR